MYFNVNFNVFFKLIKVHSLVIEIYSLRRIDVTVGNLFVAEAKFHQ